MTLDHVTEEDLEDAVIANLKVQWEAAQATLRAAQDSARAIADAYDEHVAANVAFVDEVRDWLVETLRETKRWMEGGFPDEDVDPRPSHLGRLVARRSRWTVSADPARGWLMVGYDGVYRHRDTAVKPYDTAEDWDEHVGSVVREVFDVRDWWYGGHHSHGGFCCNTTSRSEPVRRPPAHLRLP